MSEVSVKEEGEISDDDSERQQPPDKTVPHKAVRNRKRRRARSSSRDKRLQNTKPSDRIRKTSDRSLTVREKPSIVRRMDSGSRSKNPSCYKKFPSSTDCDKATDNDVITVISSEDSNSEDGTKNAGSMQNEEEEDLDELQLRRDALNSAYKFSKSRVSSSGDAKSSNLLNGERQHVDVSVVCASCGPLKQNSTTTTRSNLIPVACDSFSVSNIDQIKLPAEDLNKDNYEQVEMDLDSESDHEAYSLSSDAPGLQDKQSTLAAGDQIPVSNTGSAGSSGSLQAVDSTPQPCSDSTVVVSQSPVTSINVDNSGEAAVNPTAETIESKSTADINVNFGPKPDAAKVLKSELLLREALLHSLMSMKRSQQDHTSAVRSTEATTNASKCVVTSTTSNKSVGQLPVHQPLIISLAGESSDSDDKEFESASSCYTQRTTASGNFANVCKNVDRLLREIRQNTEQPKSPLPSTVTPVDPQRKQISESNSVSQLPLPSNVSATLTASTCPLNKPLSSNSTKDTKTLQLTNITAKTTVMHHMNTKISHEKRRLQQQKIGLAKAKLKMARRKEQVTAAEKHVKKFQEQLAEAEKIAASCRKQVDTSHHEILTLSRGIELSQKNVSKLEDRLRIVCSKLGRNSAISEDSHRTSFDDSRQKVLVSSRKSIPSCQSTRVKPKVHSNSILDSAENIRFQNPNYMSLNIKRAKLHGLEKSRHSASDSVLLEDKSAEGCVISQANCNEVDTIADDREISVDQHSESDSRTKPCIDVTNHSVLTSPNPNNDDDSVLNPVDNCPSKLAGTVSENDVVLSDKKIEQILDSYNTMLNRPTRSSLYSQLFDTDPVLSFKFPVDVTLFVANTFVTADSNSDVFSAADDLYRPYRSSLLCFNSYRFNVRGQQQQKVSVLSTTLSHKLDPGVVLCQFDLMGKCLDDACPWQHQSDYSLTNSQLLIDILSYYPSVADVDIHTPLSSYEELLHSYVCKFVSRTCSQSSVSDQCMCLIDHLRTAAGLHGSHHAICTSTRHWRLPRNKSSATATLTDVSDFHFTSEDGIENFLNVVQQEPTADDARYWTTQSDCIKNIEEALIATPTNDVLWTKLAYEKMAEVKWTCSADECISNGLNVLARAVEANPSSNKLWKTYLDLYMKRSDAENDASSLYEQAIQYAPSYEFFWQYLQLPLSYSQKMNICKRLRQYLCSPMCRDNPNVQSHHLLETVLYQAALCSISGRLNVALDVIRTIARSPPSVIWLKLVPSDRITMWLAFIHLYEYQELPKTLYDPVNSNPGAIVRKEPLIIPFQPGIKTRVSYDTLVLLFQSALSACEDSCVLYESPDEYQRWVSALYHSRILLELAFRDWSAAHKLCQQTLEGHPELVNIWVLHIHLIVASGGCGFTPGPISDIILRTTEQALVRNPYSVSLFLAAVCACIASGDPDRALHAAENCPMSLFDVNRLLTSTVDPNLLYCCLLGLPVPPNYRPPALRSSVSQQYIAEQQSNLWLGYCLLLDLQGAHDQAAEAYHIALSRVTSDHRRIWLAFFRRSLALMSGQLRWLRPAADEHDKRKLWQQFESDVNRALTSLPIKRCLPHSTETWDDYSGHSEIIRLHSTNVRDPEVLCEKYLHQMPGNVELALTTVNYLLEQGCVRTAHWLCLWSLHSCPRSAALWKVALSLTQRTSDIGLMRNLYAKATTPLPLSADLWKLRIMFELINKSKRDVHEILDKCRRLQVNLTSFYDSLIS